MPGQQRWPMPSGKLTQGFIFWSKLHVGTPPLSHSQSENNRCQYCTSSPCVLPDVHDLHYYFHELLAKLCMYTGTNILQIFHYLFSSYLSFIFDFPISPFTFTFLCLIRPLPPTNNIGLANTVYG